MLSLQGCSESEIWIHAKVLSLDLRHRGRAMLAGMAICDSWKSLVREQGSDRWMRVLDVARDGWVEARMIVALMCLSMLASRHCPDSLRKGLVELLCEGFASKQPQYFALTLLYMLQAALRWVLAESSPLTCGLEALWDVFSVLVSTVTRQHDEVQVSIRSAMSAQVSRTIRILGAGRKDLQAKAQALVAALT